MISPDDLEVGCETEDEAGIREKKLIISRRVHRYYEDGVVGECIWKPL
jgi:hypothetical protein